MTKMANPPDRKDLIAELAATALRHDLDFGAKLKRSFRANAVAWFGGAAVLGLLLSKLPPARRKVVIHGPALRSEPTAKAGKAAFALTALKFAFDFVKPALLRWVNARYLSRSGAPR